jgi:hypothetical protein
MRDKDFSRCDELGTTVLVVRTFAAYSKFPAEDKSIIRTTKTIVPYSCTSTEIKTTTLKVSSHSTFERRVF